MSFFSIFPYYLAWHYKDALVGIAHIWSNALWFVWRFFSIKTLLKTFFAPFKRLKEKYKGGLDLEDFFESLVVTMLMRLVGMVLRTFVIIAGLFFWIVILVGGVVLYLIWFVLPFILAFLFFLAFNSVFNFSNL